jgi:uncharacterized MAPEG superfamily protein
LNRSTQRPQSFFESMLMRTRRIARSFFLTQKVEPARFPSDEIERLPAVEARGKDTILNFFETFETFCSKTLCALPFFNPVGPTKFFGSMLMRTRRIARSFFLTQTVEPGRFFQAEIERLPALQETGKDIILISIPLRPLRPSVQKLFAPFRFSIRWGRQSFWVSTRKRHP